MGAGTDVHAHIDPPEQRAVQLDAVNIALSGIALDGHVLGVGGIPLDEELILAVAVHIAHGQVVGGVLVGLTSRRNTALGLVQGNIQIAICPGLHRRTRGCHLAIHQRCHGVFILHRAGCIHIVGAVGHSGDHRAVFEHRKIAAGEALLGRTLHLFPQESPGQIHTVCRFDGHQATVKLLQLHFHLCTSLLYRTWF